MKYAVIRTGGKQYRVAEGEVVKVEKLDGEVGEKVVLEDVLLVGGEGDAKIGAPYWRRPRLPVKSLVRFEQKRLLFSKRSDEKATAASKAIGSTKQR